MRLVSKNFLFIRLLITLSIILLMASVLAAQAPKSNSVDWVGIGGKNNEFLFLIPEGFQTSADGEIYIGKRSDYVVAKDHRIAARYINGVVLMMDYYEGKAAEIQRLLAELYQGELLKEETINGFQAKYYRKTNPEYSWEQQYFYNKNSLYLMHAIYRGERNKIAENFFKSVRLVNNQITVSPNLPKDVKKSALMADYSAIAIEPVSEEIVEQPDKRAVILYRPKPVWNREFGRSNAGTVKFKVLLFPSGKVAKAERIFSPTVGLADGVRPSAENLIFLPAEKNGKAVASWETIDYSFQITLIGY